jgi:hypothetical protein
MDRPRLKPGHWIIREENYGKKLRSSGNSYIVEGS